MISELSTCPRPRTTSTGRWPVSTVAQPEGSRCCPHSSHRRARPACRSAWRMGQTYVLSLPSLSLFWELGLLASLQVGVRTWLSGPGPRGEVAAACKAGREGRWLLGEQGAPTLAPAAAPRLWLLGPTAWHMELCCLPAPLPQPPAVGSSLLLGQPTARGPSLSGAHIASSQILTSRFIGHSPRPSHMFQKACLGW